MAIYCDSLMWPDRFFFFCMCPPSGTAINSYYHLLLLVLRVHEIRHLYHDDTYLLHIDQNECKKMPELFVLL